MADSRGLPRAGPKWRGTRGALYLYASLYQPYYPNYHSSTKFHQGNYPKQPSPSNIRTTRRRPEADLKCGGVGGGSPPPETNHAKAECFRGSPLQGKCNSAYTAI